MYPVVSKPAARARAASVFISSANKRPFCALYATKLFRGRLRVRSYPNATAPLGILHGLVLETAQKDRSSHRTLSITYRIIAISALPRLQTLQDHGRSPATASFARWPRDAGLGQRVASSRPSSRLTAISGAIKFACSRRVMHRKGSQRRAAVAAPSSGHATIAPPRSV
jgi:hypothetical protein